MSSHIDQTGDGTISLKLCFQVGSTIFQTRILKSSTVSQHDPFFRGRLTSSQLMMLDDSNNE